MVRNSTHTEIAILGAGPYGLSIASRVNAAGISHRVFGRPMQSWRDHMPKGMHLKSEGFASTFYHPAEGFSLGDYCQRYGLAYEHTGIPVSLDTFNAYGADFQSRCVPQLEQRKVVSISHVGHDFDLVLEDGDRLSARKVIVATGLTHFEYLPPRLSGLPREFVTHSSAHRDPEVFKGRELAVLGAGASALDFAGLAHDAGASVRVYARNPVINFHNAPKNPRPLANRLRAPMTGLGPGWRSLLCTEAPLLFHKMPKDFRLFIVKRHLGAAPGWVIKDKVLGRVPLHLSHALESAEIIDGRVQLRFRKPDGSEEKCVVDHVVAGTGYRPDLNRLPFLPETLKRQIATVGTAPALDTFFQSSVQGLYFVGPIAAPSFGPLLRFVYGGGFACRRLMKHLPKAVRSRAAIAVPASNPTWAGDLPDV